MDEKQKITSEIMHILELLIGRGLKVGMTFSTVDMAYFCFKGEELIAEVKGTYEQRLELARSLYGETMDVLFPLTGDMDGVESGLG